MHFAIWLKKLITLIGHRHYSSREKDIYRNISIDFDLNLSRSNSTDSQAEGQVPGELNAIALQDVFYLLDPPPAPGVRPSPPVSPASFATHSVARRSNLSETAADVADRLQ